MMLRLKRHARGSKITDPHCILFHFTSQLILNVFLSFRLYCVRKFALQPRISRKLRIFHGRKWSTPVAAFFE